MRSGVISSFSSFLLPLSDDRVITLYCIALTSQEPELQIHTLAGVGKWHSRRAEKHQTGWEAANCKHLGPFHLSFPWRWSRDFSPREVLPQHLRGKVGVGSWGEGQLLAAKDFFTPRWRKQAKHWRQMSPYRNGLFSLAPLDILGMSEPIRKESGQAAFQAGQWERNVCDGDVQKSSWRSARNVTLSPSLLDVKNAIDDALSQYLVRVETRWAIHGHLAQLHLHPKEKKIIWIFSALENTWNILSV